METRSGLSLSLFRALSFSLTHTHSLSLTLSLSYNLPRSLSHTISLGLSHTQSPSVSLSHSLPRAEEGAGEAKARPGLTLKRGPIKKPDRALQKLVRVYLPSIVHSVVTRVAQGKAVSTDRLALASA